MRALLVVLSLVVLALAAALYVGIVRLDQTRPAVVQAPAFHADVGRVTMGSQERTLTVPVIDVVKPGVNTQAVNAQAPR